MITRKIHDAIAMVCPIIGVSIGVLEDKTTWGISFDPTATDAQKNAAQVAMDVFDTTSAMTKESNDAASLIVDSISANADETVAELKSLTPAQARAWIVANVNNLDDAKSLLATMASILCVLARKL